MTMQQAAQQAPARPIPQNVIERIESEWKQMRENAPQQGSERR